MADPDLPAGPRDSLFDKAEWAVLSTGVLETDPPLVVEALTFAVPAYLDPLFRYLTTPGTGDTNTLAEFVAEASGLEFDSFDAITVRDSAPPAEFAARVGNLLRDFVGATGIGIEDGGDLAAELAELRLPVFGSQPRDSKPLKDWVEGTGNVLMCIGVLAGTHAPALLVFTAPALLALAGPVGAIITLGTYAIFGGAWAINHVRQRRAEQRAEALREAAEVKAAEAKAAEVKAAEAKAALDARHAAIEKKQERLKARAPKLTILPGPGHANRT